MKATPIDQQGQVSNTTTHSWEPPSDAQKAFALNFLLKATPTFIPGVDIGGSTAF